MMNVKVERKNRENYKRRGSDLGSEEVMAEKEMLMLMKNGHKVFGHKFPLFIAICEQLNPVCHEVVLTLSRGMSASPSPMPETANINGYLKGWHTGGSRQKAFTSLAPDNLLYIMSFLLPDDILSLRLVSNISFWHPEYFVT
jgi:hypothetical protein